MTGAKAHSGVSSTNYRHCSTDAEHVMHEAVVRIHNIYKMSPLSNAPSLNIFKVDSRPFFAKISKNSMRIKIFGPSEGGSVKDY